MRVLFSFFAICLLLSASTGWAAIETGVRIKELSRIADEHDNAIVGYGLVTGLAGTGDSARSFQTMQSLRNLLRRFDVVVPEGQVRSRNTAAVMVTATLPAYSQPGDKLDVNVTSLGDARSLLGGTLVLTHLVGPDSSTYALAQGPVSVGGFKYDLNGNVVQKNHPTAATIPAGATVERTAGTALLTREGKIWYVLHDPDFTTASRIAEALNDRLGPGRAKAVDAARVWVTTSATDQANLVAFLTRIENTVVTPDRPARVVINERTGTVVSGGDVRISQTTISHGDLKVEIDTEFFVSQPLLVRQTGPGVRTQVVPQTTIQVVEQEPISVSLPKDTSVADLVAALNKVKATSRDIITILQAIKRAGALHAELIIQ